MARLPPQNAIDFFVPVLVALAAGYLIPSGLDEATAVDGQHKAGQRLVARPDVPRRVPPAAFAGEEGQD